MLRSLSIFKLGFNIRNVTVIASLKVNVALNKSRRKLIMPKPGYYAVRVGRKPGVYLSWPDCERQTKGFPNAVYKKFSTEELANNFLNNPTSLPKSLDNVVAPFINDQDDIIDITVPNDVNLWSEDDFNSPTNSESDLTVKVPQLIYPSSSRDSYYAVHRGKKPGVYRTWTECSQQIKDFTNASYRKFDNELDALEYFGTGGIKKATKREIRCMDMSNNKVIKKRKLGSRSFEYILEHPDDEVVVFTDGASSANGRRISRAGIGVYWGPNHPLNTSKRIMGRQTNNRAEIYAAVHALNQAKNIGAKKVKLYTDSQFVIHSITDWIKKWKNNGWKLVTGKDVVNKEDFIALDSAQQDLDVEWIYVRAHARNHGNDEADKLAVAGAKLLMQPKNCSEFEKLHIESNEEETNIEPFLVTNAASTSREILPLVLPDIKEKKPYYAVYRGHKIGIYSTWTECEKQINDFPKPRFKKFFSEEEAMHFVRTGNCPKPEIKVPEYKDDEFVTVFTDGASSSNGKDNAQAGIGVYWGPGNLLNTSMKLPGRQTNNRAEIWAAIHALRQAKRLNIKNVRLYTDSKFVINGITSWIENWKKNGWKSSQGKTVINEDDFKALDEARQGLNVDWQYVKGHDNNPGNVEADKLAVAGCRKKVSDAMIIG